MRTAVQQLPPHERHHIAYCGPERLETMLDPIRFGQVLTNLLDNAITFSPEGGTIRIDLDVEGGSVHCAIVDEGIGIPPALREDVFTRFRRAHPDSQLSGLGLGLYVCREIVELHGGTIQIEDTTGRGTTVTIILPQAAP